MRNFLFNWAVNNNVSQNSLDSLLGGLCEHIPDLKKELPLSSKTLLKTGKNANAIPMCDGYYCHIGIKRCLIAVCVAFSKSLEPLPKEFVTDFNIDGVCHLKSTKTSL